MDSKPGSESTRFLALMKNILISRTFLSMAATWFLCLPAPAQVLKVVVNDTIQPITEEYIARALDEAQRKNDQALLIAINTPGGLVDSTRKIIEKITASPIPVIIYVTPGGSRAASAGFFILEAADVAAMAPGTNTGAAHPVVLGGGKMDDVMKDGKRCRGPDALGRRQARTQCRSCGKHRALLKVLHRAGSIVAASHRVCGIE